jgi:Domain of unknown function (DUF4304)
VVCHSVHVSAPTAQDLYREMMNHAVSPLMKSAGFTRKGQVFEKARNDRNARVDFQKDRYNTKHHISFTINLAVVSPKAVEEQLRAQCGAQTYWGQDVEVVPTGGQWHDRIGVLLGVGDYWWSFGTRVEMEDAARSVVSALRDKALPRVEEELDRPLIFPSYVIETAGIVTARGPRLWPVPEGMEPPKEATGGPDLRTPPHTWPIDGGPPGLLAWLRSEYPGTDDPTP